MRNFKTEGFIIKRRNFGEADRMLTVFTKQYGKLQVKAVGVRRIPSRRSPHVELLNESLLTLYKGRTMPILTEAQTIQNYSVLKEDLEKIGFAYHLCELMDGLCAENQEQGGIYELFKQTLDRLSEEQEIAPIIHEFEIDLLTRLGFWSENRSTEDMNTQHFIEMILEKKLKTRQMLQIFQ